MPDIAEVSQNSHPSQIRQRGGFALLLLALVVRLPGIDRPLLGVFATKNVVYGMIARNWAEGRADWHYPTLDCLVEGQRGLHMLELPVSAYLTGAAWSWLGGSLDVWGRSTAVLFSVASVALVYVFMCRRHGPRVALGAGYVLALSPVAIIYGQSFMLEASLMCFTLATFVALDRLLTTSRYAWAIVAGAALTLTLLTKIYMLVLLLPLGCEIARAWREAVDEKGRRLCLVGAGTLLVAILPGTLWYGHAAETAAPGGPRANHVYYSVRSSVDAHYPPHPLLKTPDFYGQLLDDVTGPVMTPLGFGLLLAGFLCPGWRRYLPWLVASLVLVLLLPRKFHEMNYYFLAVLPVLAIVAGLGWAVLADRLALRRRGMIAVLLIALLFSLRGAIRPAFVTPEEDRAVPRAAARARALTEADVPLVTMHGSTIDLLYYCNRPGWAVEGTAADLIETLASCHAQGAEYLVVAGPDTETIATLLEGIRPTDSGEQYAVYSLAAVLPRISKPAGP